MHSPLQTAERCDRGVRVPRPAGSRTSRRHGPVGALLVQAGCSFAGLVAIVAVAGCGSGGSSDGAAEPKRAAESFQTSTGSAATKPSDSTTSKSAHPPAKGTKDARGAGKPGADHAPGSGSTEAARPPTLDELLAALGSPDTAERTRAAARLVETTVAEDRRAAVTAALVPALTSSDISLRRTAARAVREWSGGAELPAMLRLADHSDAPVREDALRLLGAFRDPRVPPVLMAHLTVAQDRPPARDALVELGPFAEEAVLARLMTDAVPTEERVALVSILERIGTAKSIDVLATASEDEEPRVATAAQRALAAIEGKR